MSDNFTFIDNIYRSRITLLDILEEKGYDVTKYRKFSPAEATAAAAAARMYESAICFAFSLSIMVLLIGT
jgi:hypothetical protein